MAGVADDPAVAGSVDGAAEVEPLADARDVGDGSVVGVVAEDTAVPEAFTGVGSVVDAAEVEPLAGTGDVGDGTVGWVVDGDDDPAGVETAPGMAGEPVVPAAVALAGSAVGTAGIDATTGAEVRDGFEPVPVWGVDDEPGGAAPIIGVDEAASFEPEAVTTFVVGTTETLPEDGAGIATGIGAIGNSAEAELPAAAGLAGVALAATSIGAASALAGGVACTGSPRLADMEPADVVVGPVVTLRRASSVTICAAERLETFPAASVAVAVNACSPGLRDCTGV